MQRVEKRAAAEQLRSREVERPQEQARAVVDLGPVHLIVARHVDEPVAELDVDGDRLGEERRASRAERRHGQGPGEKRAAVSSWRYFRSWGETLEPCTATWHVVQLR